MPNSPASVRAERWPEILRLWREGQTAVQIAETLGLHYDLCKNYVYALAASEDPDAYVADRIRRLTPKKRAIPNLSDEERLAAEVRAQRDDAEERFQKKLLKDALSQKAAMEVLLEAVAAAIKAVPQAKVPILKAPKVDSSAQTALLLFSDLHIGQRVRPEETQGIGNYSYPIFRKRLAVLRDSVRSITQHHRMSHPVGHLEVAALGDNIENTEIFSSQRLQVDMNLMEQLFAGIEDVSEFLLGLLDVFQTIHYTGIVGNHGRIGKKGDQLSYINFDYVMGRAIQYKLANYADRITFDIPESFWKIREIQGQRFLMMHGDVGMARGFAGIPWYGIQRSQAEWTGMLASQREWFDYTLLGHFHTPVQLTVRTGEILMNGAFPGANDFSIGVMRSATGPSQLFSFVHPKLGVTARYPVKLDR